MKSIRDIYKIGLGPSSSHTMGPRKASEIYLKRYANYTDFKVVLYGSLAATGDGHLTLKVIRDVFVEKKLILESKPEIFHHFHPNSMDLFVLENGQETHKMRVYSVGGGDIRIEGEESYDEELDYLNTMDRILYWTEENACPIWQYVEDIEGPGIADYMFEVWQTMQAAITRGLNAEGAMPGGLRLQRKAYTYFTRTSNQMGIIKKPGSLFSYALAVSEENACGGVIVTAPTCGSCGVLPAVLRLMQEEYQLDDIRIIHALETAGIIGNLVKENASISGAEVGCQGEIGAASAMAAAAVAQLMGGTPSQIEYAAEMGMEHHLGLTCDPVLGLVQIPCIERNAFGAERAFASATFALLSDGRHRVSFDQVVQTMAQTGKDMNKLYRETAQGGLAIFSRQ